MKLSAIFISLMLLTACSQHMYSASGKCITCWNNPVTGKPINHDGKDNTETENVSPSANNDTVEATKQVQEHKISFPFSANVDIAYLKIKKALAYQSDQEIRQEWGSMASAKMETFAYHYEATPGVYYKMRADRKHNNVQAIIDTQIEKASAKSSQITMTYWLRDDSVNPDDFGNSLKSYINGLMR